MKKSLFFFTLGLLLLAACGGGKRYHALMHEADSLLTAGDAVTAYRLLAEADSQKTGWSRREEMDYELLKAQAQNRAYVDFQTDSVLRVVARYYDRHGTPNQRLRAHYLLGCAYRDLHESPLALLSWEDAVACADTLSPACDFATLFRVYGQMADVYFRQFMPEKELVVRENFCHYALLAGDTLNYIRGLLLRNSAYLALGDTNAVFRNINHVRDLYLESGRKQEAAQVYPTAISIALDNKQYDRAHSMMIILENESGLFDERGNIKRTYEKYYYQKGRYYLGVHQNDSAEQQFRKLLSFDIMKVDGYQGLIATFRQKQDADSIYKYSELYSKALVQYQNYTQTEAIAQAEGMYDYHRLERIAASQAKKAHRRKVLLTMIASVSVITLALIVIYFRRKKELQEKAFQKAITIYLQAKTELDKLHLEVQILRDHLPLLEETRQLLNEKEAKVQELEHLVSNYQERLGHPIPPKDEDLLMHSDIVLLLHDICHLQSVKKGNKIEMIQPRACTEMEWQELLTVLKRHDNNFHNYITVKRPLPKLQYKVCILSRLHFDVSEMAVLLGTTMPNISNARKRAVQKLFDSSNPALLDTLLSEL